MKNTAFTWRIGYGERKQMLNLLGFLEQASDILEYNEKCEVEVSYLPTENLIRLMALVPGQPTLTHILMCELDEERQTV